MDANKISSDYSSLYTISRIFKIIGIIFVIIFLIVFIIGISLLSSRGDEMVGIYLIISSLIGGLLIIVPLFAFAELIKLFIRIEINTRKEKLEITNRVLTNSIKTPKDEEYEKWRMENPTKTLNDYYASKR